LPDDEFASCRRQVAWVRDQLTARQASWGANPGARWCPWCHVSAVVEDVDGMTRRPRGWRCLSCGREVLSETEVQAAEKESTREPVPPVGVRGDGQPESRLP
jgi:hypothetical protein